MSEAELQRLLDRCRVLPTGPDYRENDYVSNLLITVLDFRFRVAGVDKGMDYYREKRWAKLRTHYDIERLLRRFPNNRTGNEALESRQRPVAALGGAVALAMILMKLLPFAPGHFGRAELAALAGWMALGWALRRSGRYNDRSR